MKNIFKIHPIFYLVAIISIFSGLFKNFILFTSIILFHELGHIIGALIMRWKIKKIILLPFGGLIIFDELLNRRLIEEFVILILGPLFQILFYFIFKDNVLIKEYNYNLLLFNMLPIIPLDGSKLLNIILNKIFSFSTSHILSIVVSCITIIFMISNRELIIYLILLFLIIKNIKELKYHNHLVNKFILERYLYKIKFKKIKIIKGLNLKKMKKDHKHIFYNNKYFLEEELIKLKYLI